MSRRGSRTRSFGSPARIAHDSTPFYSRRLYEGLPEEENVPYQETPLPPECANRVFCKSAERMDEMPDGSVHLMVTSPPYNVGKDYDDDLTLDEYRAFLKRVMAEVHRVLVPGGRACINLADLGRRPYLPLHAFVVQDMLELGFLMRGEIIWDKASSASPSTAWGSWCSPQNPNLRDTHEYILSSVNRPSAVPVRPGAPPPSPATSFWNTPVASGAFRPNPLPGSDTRPRSRWNCPTA